MSDAPPTEVNPGLPLFADRYRIERSLGRGGMGEVDYAYDTVLRRPVAIKRLLMGATDPSAERRASRLLREARAVALLNHPNVVSVHDVGDAAGVPFVVMELAEGGSLRARLGRQGRPPMALALAWLSDVADALACAHRAGLVHRDIKPENLLLTADDRVKVADFGAAKELARPMTPDARTLVSATSAQTREGFVVGTPGHMAPEQLRGEPLDGRTDQYAWGLVAYELLAGVHPYHAEGAPTPEQRIADGAFVPPPLGPRVAGLPAEVEGIVMRALSADPAARAADMAAVKVALDRARRPTRTAPIPAVQASPPRQAPAAYPLVSAPPAPHARSGRVLFVLLAVLLALAAIGLPVGLLFVHLAGAPPQYAADASPPALASAAPVSATVTLAFDDYGLEADVPPGTTLGRDFKGVASILQGPAISAVINLADASDPKTLDDAMRKTKIYSPTHLKTEQLDDGWTLTWDDSASAAAWGRRLIAGKSYVLNINVLNTDVAATAKRDAAVAAFKSLRPSGRTATVPPPSVHRAAPRPAPAPVPLPTPPRPSPAPDPFPTQPRGPDPFSHP